MTQTTQARESINYFFFFFLSKRRNLIRQLSKVRLRKQQVISQIHRSLSEYLELGDASPLHQVHAYHRPNG